MKIFLFLTLVVFLAWHTPARGEEDEQVPDVAIIAILEEQFPGFPEGAFRLDPVHGILTIDATPEEYDKIRRILERLDAPTPQISIEAKFLELTVTELGEVMVDLDAPGITVDGEVIQLLSPWVPDTPPLQPGEPGILRHPEAPAIEFFARKDDPKALTAVLRALEEEGEAEIISAPRVTTLNNREATIELLVTVPYVAAVTWENIGTEEEPIWVRRFHIEEREAGVTLEVTPSVTPGETLIALHLELTVAALEERLGLFPGAGAALGWPIIGERTATTQMVIESGETIILGGMIDSRKEVEKGRIPLLGDIPILGHLFRFEHHKDEKKMLLIFITPYILSPAGEKIVAAR